MGPGVPSRALNTHTHICRALGRAQVPFGSEISCSRPGAGGGWGVGLVRARPWPGCVGCGISLTAAGLRSGLKGLSTGHLLTLAGPRPVREAVF